MALEWASVLEWGCSEGPPYSYRQMGQWTHVLPVRIPNWTDLLKTTCQCRFRQRKQHTQCKVVWVNGEQGQACIVAKPYLEYLPMYSPSTSQVLQSSQTTQRLYSEELSCVELLCCCSKLQIRQGLYKKLLSLKLIGPLGTQGLYLGGTKCWAEYTFVKEVILWRVVRPNGDELEISGWFNFIRNI